MSEPALVEASEVAGFLQRQVAQDVAERAVRIAVGWLRPRVRTLSWPPDLDQHPDLWSALVELAAIAVDNPTGMRSSTSGGVTDEWSVDRREQILGEIEARYGAAQPVGSFPPASSWPQ